MTRKQATERELDHTTGVQEDTQDTQDTQDMQEGGRVKQAPKAKKRGKKTEGKKPAAKKEPKAKYDVGEKKVKKGTLSPIPVNVVKVIKQKMDTEHPGMIKNMTEIKLVTEKFLETIVEMTKSQKSVALPNYFTFKPVRRNERVHRNPQNGELVKKPAHFVLCMDVKNKLKSEFASLPIEKEQTNQ